MPAPVLVNELAWAVPQVFVLLLISFAEINKSVAAVPLPTSNVVPVTELPEPSITLAVPEIVDCVLPVTVTVPARVQAMLSGKVCVYPPVEVSVPPARVRLLKRLKKAPLLVMVPPALIVIGVTTLSEKVPNTL